MRNPNPMPQRDRFPEFFRNETLERNERLLLDLQRGSGRDYRAFIPSNQIRKVIAAAESRAALPVPIQVAVWTGEFFGTLF